jgi:CDP-diacylglycerol--serine O-phosphatidyltransferase
VSPAPVRGMLPGLFTMGNLVAGFLSIRESFAGDLSTAAWLIVLAAFLDLLDGMVARAADASTPFGVEIDSLADVVSFGVGPAALLNVALASHSKWAWLIGLLFLMAGAARLARFNITAVQEHRSHYIGLPIPSAATVVAGYVIFTRHIWGTLRYQSFLIGLVVLLSFLMVSTLRYDRPGRFTRWRVVNVLFVFAFVGAGAALLFHPQLTIFPVMFLFAASGPARDVANRLFYGQSRRRE